MSIPAFLVKFVHFFYYSLCEIYSVSQNNMGVVVFRNAQGSQKNVFNTFHFDFWHLSLIKVLKCDNMLHKWKTLIQKDFHLTCIFTFCLPVGLSFLYVPLCCPVFSYTWQIYVFWWLKPEFHQRWSTSKIRAYWSISLLIYFGIHGVICSVPLGVRIAAWWY